MTKEIELTRGFVALVDDDWFPVLNEFSWCAAPNKKTGKTYAVWGRLVTMPTRKTIVLHMHRLIMGDPTGMLVDHHDGNPMNNRRSNLRICTSAQNNQNRKIGSRNKSGFKGVFWHKGNRKFVAVVQIGGGKKLFYKLFNDPVEAARAYDQAALQHFGEFALTNQVMGLLPPQN